MAFTPSTTIPGESWWSPAAIVMVFEIDQSGFAGFWRSGLSIIVLWLVIMIFSFLGRWLWRKRQAKAIDSRLESEQESQQEPDSENKVQAAE